MKKSNQSGFGAVELILTVVIVGILGFIGWYVWHSQRSAPVSSDQVQQSAQLNSADTYTTGSVTFLHASQFSPSLRSEIVAKITDPLIYYETKDIKTDLKGVEIDLGLAPDNKARSAKYGYILTEIHADKNNHTGFVFGEQGRINYWLPGLCDEGGCLPYPKDLKSKFPATYQAYEASLHPTK